MTMSGEKLCPLCDRPMGQHPFEDCFMASTTEGVPEAVLAGTCECDLGECTCPRPTTEGVRGAHPDIVALVERFTPLELATKLMLAAAYHERQLIAAEPRATEGAWEGERDGHWLDSRLLRLEDIIATAPIGYKRMAIQFIADMRDALSEQCGRVPPDEDAIALWRPDAQHPWREWESEGEEPHGEMLDFIPLAVAQRDLAAARAPEQLLDEARELRGLLSRAYEVIRRGEIRIDADCSPESPLARQIKAALAAASPTLPNE